MGVDAEGRAGHQREPLLFQQILAQADRATLVHPGAQVGEGVEGAARPGRREAQLGERPEQPAPAAIELRAHGGDLGGLAQRRGERGQVGALGDRVGGAGHLGLQRDDRLDRRARPGREADAVAGHGEDLARAIQHDRALARGLAGADGAGVGRALVHQAPVDLVGEDPQVVLYGDARQLRHLLRGPHVAARIGGRVQEHRAAARRDRAPDGGEVRTQVGAAGDLHRHRAGDAHDFHVADPGRQEQQDLVARIDHGEHRARERVLGAVADDHVLGGAGDGAGAPDVGRDGLAQGRRAGSRRVAHRPVERPLRGGPAGGLGSLEVRLADRHVDHVGAGGGERLGARVQRQRDRDRDATGAL